MVEMEIGVDKVQTVVEVEIGILAAEVGMHPAMIWVDELHAGALEVQAAGVEMQTMI